MNETYDEVTVEITQEQMNVLAETGNGTVLEQLTNYEPTAGSDVHNASAAMDWCEYEEGTNRCAQYAQMFVIEEFTGRELNIDEFVSISEENGWYSEDAGTSLENMNKMLDYFGIENEVSTGKSFGDLVECLENGGRLIVALDGGEYIYGEGVLSDLSDPTNGPDHAVEVIGYDAERGMVIVNDSDLANGAGLEIPVNTFLDAWADSSNYMIECYGTSNYDPGLDY